VHKLLQPFYQKRGMKAYSYSELWYRYIILNGAPHTAWETVSTQQEQPLAAAL
jgi:hypothetical protein